MKANRGPGRARKQPPQQAGNVPSTTPAEAELIRTHLERRRERPMAPRAITESAAGKDLLLRPDHADRMAWQALFEGSMGTVEPAFANLVFGQLLNATCDRDPKAGFRQADINAALAAMHRLAPRDEVEAMLSAQMVAAHGAAMTMLRRLKDCNQLVQQDSAGRLAVKLLRTCAAQVEALQRYRGKGQQTVRVEHVNVAPGAQAVVGVINQRPAGDGG